MDEPASLAFLGTGDFTHPTYGADGTGTAPDGVDRTLTLNPTQQTDGLPTEFAWGYRSLLRLTYNEVFPGVTFEPQLLWFHDVQGQTPSPILNLTERREALKPLKKKISQLEIQISRLQKTIADYDEKLADPALYAKDPARATSLNKQRADAAKTLASCEEDWLGLTEEHAAAMAAE